MVKPNYVSIHPKSASWLAPLQPAPLTDYGPVVQYANSPVTRPIVLPFLPQRQPLLALIFTCLLRDGQAELNCVTGYIPRWFFRSRSPNKLLTRQRTAGSQARAHQAFCLGGTNFGSNSLRYFAYGKMTAVKMVFVRFLWRQKHFGAHNCSMM